MAVGSEGLSMSSASNLSSSSSNNNSFNNITIRMKVVYFHQKKLVAIGDIHGDLSVAKCLKLANVIDRNIPNDTVDIRKINWSGGNTFVVQLGDQIDRVRPTNYIIVYVLKKMKNCIKMKVLTSKLFIYLKN